MMTTGHMLDPIFNFLINDVPWYVYTYAGVGMLWWIFMHYTIMVPVSYNWAADNSAIDKKIVKRVMLMANILYFIYDCIMWPLSMFVFITRK